MRDQLLRPKVAFLVGLGALIIGFAIDAFVSPSLFLAAQSIGFPLASTFATGLVDGLNFIAWVARLGGPALMAAALVLLKLDRLSSAGAFRPAPLAAPSETTRD